METLLEKLSFSEKALRKMVALQNGEKEATQKVEEIESELSNMESRVGSSITGDVILGCVGFIVCIVIFFISRLVGKFIEFVCRGIFDGFNPNIFVGVVTGIALVIAIIFIVSTVRYSIEDKQTLPERIERKKEELIEAKRKLVAINSELMTLKKSEDWSKAVSYIPKDYFNFTAIAKMKSFAANGRAETMKEAISLYEEFLHREKLEHEAERMANEAQRAADEARRAADNSEITASSATQAAEYAKITADKIDDIELEMIINKYK